MRKQIIKVLPHQTAKVMAILYGILGLIFTPFILLISLLGPKEQRMGIGFAILFPFIYMVFGYIFVGIFAWLYNFVAGHVGGVEFETRDGEPEADAPLA